MPLNTGSTSTFSPEEFCLALKAARERKGITLAEIAAVTKISAYLMEGLERNDLRRWPTGLFRRSFFRDYVRMIGLPVAELSAEFIRLFPDAEHDPATVVEHLEVAKPPGTSVLAAVTAALRRAIGPPRWPRFRVRLKVPK